MGSKLFTKSEYIIKVIVKSKHEILFLINCLQMFTDTYPIISTGVI